jgi:hypothetical protein
MTLVLLSGSACKKKETPIISKGTRFASIEELAKFVTENLNEGNSSKIIEVLVSREDYLKNIYPHTPEGRAHNAMSGDDAWRLNLIGAKRISGVYYRTGLYKGRIHSLVSVGKPQVITEAGTYTFLRRIPVTMEIEDGDGNIKQETDDEILAIVIQHEKSYMLFNVFK